MYATRRFNIDPGSQQPDTVVALLGELPFHAFETEGERVRAYLLQSEDQRGVQAAVGRLAARFGWTVSSEELPETNWNAAWERGYTPVEIEGFLRVSAPFHPPAPGFAHELVIVPEMSFGTGHHETTYLMAELLRDSPPSGKTCFDFGTGTGVLALLAKRLGASHVVAVDHDPRCVRSARDNAARNAIALDDVSLGDAGHLPDGPFDLILANINRSVLTESLAALAQRLVAGGEVWLSGILAEDLAVIDPVANHAGLTRRERRRRGKWLACRYALTRV